MTSKGQFVLNAQPFFSLKSSTRSSHSEIMPARQNLSHGAGVLDTHTHTRTNTALHGTFCKKAQKVVDGRVHENTCWSWLGGTQDCCRTFPTGLYVCTMNSKHEQYNSIYTGRYIADDEKLLRQIHIRTNRESGTYIDGWTSGCV